MILRCQHCHQLIQLAEEPAEGQHVRCPVCGQVFSYSAYYNAHSEETNPHRQSGAASQPPNPPLKQTFASKVIALCKKHRFITALLLLIVLGATLHFTGVDKVFLQIGESILRLALGIFIIIITIIGLTFAWHLNESAINAVFDAVYELSNYSPPKWYRKLITIIAFISILVTVGISLIPEMLVVVIRANKPQIRPSE